MVEIVGCSDIGLRRTLNEDGFSIDSSLGLAVVADGMGGHAAGEVASRTAIDAIVESLADVQAFASRGCAAGRGDGKPRALAPGEVDLVVSSAVVAANRRIFEMNQARGFGEGAGMGTTVVGLWFVGDARRVVVFNVGDSRAYRFRDGRLEQLSCDHTAFEQWRREGEAGPRPGRNLLLRAVGPWPSVDVDLIADEPRSDDLFLLCSDGLTAMVDDADIEHRLVQGWPDGLDGLCRDLVEMAKRNGGLDNVTVVCARIQ